MSDAAAIRCQTQRCVLHSFDRGTSDAASAQNFYYLYCEIILCLARHRADRLTKPYRLPEKRNDDVPTSREV